MSVILNAKLSDGSLYTIEWQDERFTSVTPQAAVIDVSDAGTLSDLARSVPPAKVDAGQALLLPGLIDAHVHSRDPGLTHKESWATLALAAAKGGVVGVVDMPNTIPPTMTTAEVQQKAERAAAAGIAHKFLLGVDERNVGTLRQTLADSSLPVCGVKVYFGHSTGNLMFDSLDKLHVALGGAKDTLVVFHSEDQCGIDHNYTSIDRKQFGEGNSAFRIHTALRSSQTAYTATKKILAWAVQHQYRVHIAHLSTPRELELIAEARQQGARITSEVAPHHLLLCDDDYDSLGPLLKVNPPVRSKAEMLALRSAFGQGAIEVFATDHAPHTLLEKAAPYDHCPSGMPSIDFFAPLLFDCAQQADLSLDKAVDMAASVPADLYGFADYGRIAPGAYANFVWIQAQPLWLDEKEVLSKCGWTPYHGRRLPVTVAATWHRGKVVYERK